MWRAVALWLALLAPALSAEEFRTLKGHGGPVMGLAVSGEGRLASASFDNSVGLWSDGAAEWLEGHEAAVVALDWGSGGQLVSGGDDFAVRLWGPGARELGRHRGKVAAIAVSPDARRVASGSWDGTITLWPLDGGEAVALPAPGAGVNALGFDAEGATLFAGTAEGALLRYDLTGPAAPLPLVQNGFGINALVVGPGWVAYGAVDGGTRVVDAETGALLQDFTLDRRPILAMDYHEGSGQIAVGDGHGFIMMLESRDWRISRDFRAMREGPVWALAFSRDGAVIHAGGLDDVIYAWPVDLLDRFEPEGTPRDFLRAADEMPNGERQFMRKCAICHALDPGPSRKAGPTLHGVFGRRAGTVEGYFYSETLRGSAITWDEASIDALFDQGPDHYIPGSKMPMQVIAAADDRADLIAYLRTATEDGEGAGR